MHFAVIHTVGIHRVISLKNHNVKEDPINFGSDLDSYSADHRVCVHYVSLTHLLDSSAIQIGVARPLVA